MKKNVMKSLIIMGFAFSLVGCGSETTSPIDDRISTELPADIKDAIDSPVSKLSEELTNTLSHMGNEERLAYDVYNALAVEYPDLGPLKNIPSSEYEHITAVQQLIQKYKLNDDIHFTNIDLPALGYINTAIEDMEAGTYDIEKIQKLYDDLVLRGAVSEIEALKVGCIIEVVDIQDLNEYIELAQQSNATDIETVFTHLRAGSYSHYWAFDKVLKNKSVTNGCCPTALEILGGTVCPDYPQK